MLDDLRKVLGDVSGLFDADEPAALQEALGETLRDLGLPEVSTAASTIYAPGTADTLQATRICSSNTG